jgi:PAS domain S-box-containing protein
MKLNNETSGMHSTLKQRIARLLPWLVLAGGLAATWFLQQAALNTALQSQQSNFDYRTREITLRIEQRLAAYNQILRGASGLFAASQQVDRDKFRNYVDHLRLSKNYPGIQSIGFSLIIPPHEKARHIDAIRQEGFPRYTMHPEGKRNPYTAIIYQEPFTGRNLRTFGYDMYSEPVRRTAMEQARDLDRTIITGKVRLAQDTAQQVQAGFLMLLPIYRTDSPHETLAERRANIIGWVYAPFRMDDLMLGLLGEYGSDIDVEIFDGENARLETRMYGTDNNLPLLQARPSLYQTSRGIDVFGHPWTMKLRSLPAFEAHLATRHVSEIRLAGILISVMLSLLVGQLVHGRARAIRLARIMTRELQESENRWKFAIEGSGDGLWDRNMADSTVFFSKRWKEMLGYAEDEIGNGFDEWEKRIHPGDKAGTLDTVQAHLDGKTPVYACENRLRCKDGSWKWILARGMVVNRTKDGKPLRIIGTHTDITARKQWELELLESEKRFRIVADAAPVLIWLSDANKLCYWFNKTWLDFTGRSMEQEQGNGWTEGVHPDDLQTCMDIYMTSFATRQPFYMEYRLKRHDGEYRWLFDSGTPRMDEQGVFSGYIGSCIDITENKKIQLDLHVSERRAKAALAELQYQKYALDQHAIVATTDTRGTITYVNDKFCQISGYTQLELLGQNRRLLNSGQHPAEFFTSMFRAIATGKVWRGEICNRAKDGSLYWVMTTIVPFLGHSGKPTHYIAIQSDITESIQAQDALRQAKLAADSANRAKSNFLANMSHEIRTPMNAIIGLSHLALNKQLAPEIQDYLEKIHRSSNSLLDILNDILDFSKIEAGRITINYNAFDLDLMLDTISNLFADHTEEKGLDFEINVAPDAPRNLIGDAIKLQQILINLIGNAIKFTGHGKVALNITPQKIDPLQAQLLFSVTDTGIGMSANDLEKLFQPFSQVDGSITRRFGGTGLGLAISHKLLQLMGGEFAVASSPGVGTTFSFELVLGVSALSGQQKAKKHKTGTSAWEPVNVGKAFADIRLLVAEDNALNQQVVHEFLKQSEISVKVANNGKEVLDLLEHDVFDAVLMDVQMPEMDGIEATKRIRGQARFERLPVIALTAGVTTEERERCIASGMNDFITKPIDPEKLIATLANWIKPIGLVAADLRQPIPLAANLAGTDDLPGFDLRNLKVMLGNSQELATQMLLSFREDMKNVPDEIEAMLTAGNFVSARELTHKIKGASGNIGAVCLYAASEALEAGLNRKPTDAATFSAFKEAFKQTMSVIAELRHPDDQLAMAPMPVTGGNLEALRYAAAELDLLLKENDFVSLSSLNTLKTHLPTDKLDLFARLCKLINGIQYGEARTILRQLVDLPDTQEP